MNRIWIAVVALCLVSVVEAGPRDLANALLRAAWPSIPKICTAVAAIRCCSSAPNSFAICDSRVGAMPVFSWWLAM